MACLKLNKSFIESLLSHEPQAVHEIGGFLIFQQLSNSGGPPAKPEVYPGLLINEVAKVAGTKKEPQAAVDCAFDTIINALKHKDQAAVIGFGTSRSSNRKARTGRELNTGEEITIKARNVPKFVAGKGLKRALQEGSGE